jgi:hypothetical protein
LTIASRLCRLVAAKAFNLRVRSDRRWSPDEHRMRLPIMKDSGSQHEGCPRMSPRGVDDHCGGEYQESVQSSLHTLAHALGNNPPFGRDLVTD